MLIYKIEGKVNYAKNPKMFMTRDKEKLSDFMEVCFVATEKFLAQNDNNIYIEPIGFSEESFSAVAISKVAQLPKEKINEYFNMIDISPKEFTLEEITVKGFNQIQNSISRKSSPYDENIFVDELQLDIFGSHSFQTYSEGLAPKYFHEESITEFTEIMYYKNSLMDEINRIFRGPSLNIKNYLPAHYILNMDIVSLRDHLAEMLISVAYEKGLLNSRRYTIYEIEGDLDDLDRIYELANDGSVLIDFNIRNPFVNAKSLIQSITHRIQRYKNRVLTIINISSKYADSKEVILKNENHINFIDINHDLLNREDSLECLRLELSKHGVDMEETGIEFPLEDGKTYTKVDLEGIFHNEFSKFINSEVYPQYNIEPTKVETSDEIRAESIEKLNEMIGLTSVKSIIQQAIDYYKVQRLYRENGIGGQKPSMHMAFMGNPGTAKTTVARLFAQIMKEQNLLSTGNFVEVGRSELVGRYVGWTASSVQRKFKKAMGGVLFIDEAYSLVDRPDSFGYEAINTIVQEMENHREDLIVIFAGYPREMATFLNTNPGLRSRIAFNVKFDDYNEEELYEIVKLLAKNDGVGFDREMEPHLIEIIRAERMKPNFGNGRFCRNIYERAKLNQASRIAKMEYSKVTKADLMTLRLEDFHYEFENEKTAVPFIGFIG